MLRIYTIALLFGIQFSIFNAHAQDGWLKNMEPSKGFIQNVGQFNRPEGRNFESKVEFVYDGFNEDFYFTKDGIVFEFVDRKKRVKSEAEKAARKARKQQEFKSLKEWQDFEDEGQRMVIESDVMTAYWLGSNPNVTIEVQDKNSFYHNFGYKKNGVEEFVDHVPSYRTLVYKDIYPNIDIIYEIHRVEGIKYSIVVRPGGDLSQVKLAYSKKPILQANGTLITNCSHGEIIDHKPVTFYEDDTKQIIDSKYKLDDNVISFELGFYDPNRTIVIDPWTQTPAYNTNWDCVWEVETDAAGNTYTIGGVVPLMLTKYNATGVQQWTFTTTYDSTEWLGTFATDDAGNSFVTNGSTARIRKHFTNGAVDWNNPSPGGLLTSTELWNIAFNCDQTKLVVGGTGGSLPPLPYIYDIDMATGNVLSSVQVTGSTIAGIPPNTQEVRSITATANEKYYFLTHDSIGYVSQNLTLCPGNSAPFHVENGGYDLGYKCENWRYNNTGMEAIAYYGGYIYTHRGDQVHKRDFNTANIIATANIPGGVYTNVFLGGNVVENSGIIIDDCGNVYVGSKTGVVKYDQNLNQLATFPTSFTVYDVDITSTGDVVAAGSTGDSGDNTRTGSVQSFAASACAQLATICCNPSICNVPNLCSTDAPVTLTVETTGGTWSSTAPGFNATTGTFDPAAAGIGSFWVYYSLACGTDSVEITVVNCSPLSVCVDTNGDLVVTGGTGPYSWDEWSAGGNMPITNQTECQNCGGTWTFGNCYNPFPIPLNSCNTPAGWVNMGTGGTYTPSAGADTVQVTDNNGTNVVFYDISTIPPCSAVCDATIDPAGPFCENDPATTLTAATTGGTWTGTGITNGSTGAFNPATAGPGSHTITYTLGCGDSDTETIVVTALDDPSFTYAQTTYCTTDPNPTPNSITTTGGTFSIDNGGTINPTTGEIDIAASGAGSFTITYSTGGTCPATGTLGITITAGADATIDPAGPFCENDPATTLTAADGGGTWSGTGITNGTTGAFDPATAGAGNHTITYVIAGSCGDTDTETITVNALDNSAFTYASNSYCLTDPNPSPNSVTTTGGTFSINNGGTINPTTGEIDIAGSGSGTYDVTYTTNGPCPTSTIVTITITTGADATIDPAGPFCENDPATTLTAADGGGTWSGTGITNGTTGEFDPATAGVGTHTITYAISGTCGDTDTETITVNALDNSAFTYAQSSYCLSDPNPSPNSVTTTGGSFSINNGGTINTTTGEIDIAASGSGSYDVTYTTNGPCPTSTVVTIIITAGADATITATTPICENEAPITLSAVDPGGTWSGTGITNGTTGEFDPAIAGVGTHTITYAISGSCGDTDTETITVLAQDDASFTYASNSYCLTDPNPSPNSVTTAGGTFSIDNSGSINPSTGEINITATGSGSYTVTYITAGTCPDTATFPINISNAFDATIDPAGPFCANDGLQTLTAVDGGGTWTGTGITNGTTGEFDPAVAGPGTHTITYTIGGSCGDTDTETITVNAVDDASFSYTTTSFCISDPDPTPSSITTAGGTFTISPSGTINGTTGEIDLDATGNGAYMVYYTTNGPCPGIDSTTITITTQADATIDPAGPFCESDPAVTFTSNGTGGTWSGTGIDPNTGLFDPSLAGPGTWEIIYTIAGGCGDADTIQVTVYDDPIADAGMDTTIYLGEVVGLNGQGGVNYTWTPPDGLSCTNCSNPNASPFTTTTYVMTITDINGCSSSDNVTVYVIEEDQDIFVPNIFSPNGDGNNDVFYVEGSNLNNFNLSIFNRWGELVFESSDQNTGWDGTQNGKGLNNAVFVYMVRYTDSAGNEQTISGNVTLLR